MNRHGKIEWSDSGNPDLLGRRARGSLARSKWGDKAMARRVEVFWSFRSPYSYLAAGRLVKLAGDTGAEVIVRPVYPLAIRTPDFFKKVNPLFVSYVVRDAKRVADYLGLPFHWPDPDPVAMNLGPGEDEQPHIHRLTRLGVEAGLRGRGPAFIDSVSRLIFGGTKGWDQGDHLAKAAARAGLDLAALDAALLADPGKYDSIIAENERHQEAAGHWGVPLMVYEGEPFFGQDRIDMLLWRMDQSGRKSAAAGT